MKEWFRKHFIDLLGDIAATDTNIVLLTILLVVIVIVLDAVSMVARKKRQETGIESNKTRILPSTNVIEGLPAREYVSEIQGLAGKPDALIHENGFVIPIERKPLAKKLRDRYVAQLLVYMRLVEEFEGKRPPYGYLVLGPQCRRIKINNSKKRQDWLQKHLNEMRDIVDGKIPCTPLPHPKKCKRCNVRHACTHAAVEEAVQINSKKKRAAKQTPASQEKEAGVTR